MSVYITAIVLAVINFIYIYVFRFDDLTEEQLVLNSPLWVLLFIFGIYGTTISKLQKQINEGKYQTLREALVYSSESFGIFGPLRQLFFFPLFFLTLKSLFLTAFVSALIWAGLLVLFFQFIFPKL